jgi:hypothetical protein
MKKPKKISPGPNLGPTKTPSGGMKGLRATPPREKSPSVLKPTGGKKLPM